MKKSYAIHFLLALIALTACSVFQEAQDEKFEYPALLAGDSKTENTLFKRRKSITDSNETGKWKYSILPCTNRRKTIEEVLENTISLEELNACYCSAAAGEQFFLLGLPDAEELLTQSILLDKLLMDLVAAAKQCNVSLSG